MPLKTINEILGQDRAIREIRKRIANDTFRGSFLFSGPEGVGKRSTALAIASALLCQKLDGCGRCATCEQISKGLHPNVTIVVPDEQGSIKIDSARQLVRRMNLHSVSGMTKMAIIDRAETLTEQAANSLLKSVEEPSGIFILVSGAAGRLPATLRSRCHRIVFQPLQEEFLKTILLLTGAVPEKMFPSILPFAEGSLTQARKLGEVMQRLNLDLPGLFKELATRSYTDLEGVLKGLPSDAEGTISLLAALRAVICRREDLLGCHEIISMAERGVRSNTTPQLVWESVAFGFQKCLTNSL